MTKLSVAAIACAVIIAANLVSAASDMKTQFEEFKAKFNKKYSSAAEESKRFAIFATNMKRAAQLSKANPLATFGMSPYADVDAADFKSTHHNAESHYKRAMASQAKEAFTDYSADEKLKVKGEAIDWRTRGAVTYVKNQGQCGSCWSFSTTGGVEGQWFLAGHKLVALSEQEFVSCDTIDSGCQGGLMDNAFKWVLQAHNGSIVTEDSYPYVSGDGFAPACSMSGTKFGAQIIGYENIAKNEDTMATWCYANGPISIAVDATSFQTYSSGILTNCISQQIDHGVLIVGFDDNNNPPYWIIKNSWGASWGEQGYIRVEKGTDQCLITSYPCSSKVHKGPSPPPPPPPPPSKKEFTQKKCEDPKCSNCHSIILPQDECIAAAKYSYKATCTSSSLIVDAYTGRKCQGSPIARTHNEINTCSVEFDTKRTETFIQNLCHSGPAPTPAPTSPPSPTPAPQQDFIQMDCSDSACTQGCQNHTFPAGQCLPLSGGGSAKAECKPTELVMTEYPLSQDCTGFSIPSTMPLDQCLANGDGQGYFENICPSSISLFAARKGVAQAGAKVISSRRRM